MKDSIGVVMYIVVIVLVTVIFGARGACVLKSDAIEAAENMGFTEAEVLDKNIWFMGFRGCSGGDAAMFELKAKNPAGKVVNINVCIGWPFKGATVRSP